MIVMPRRSVTRFFIPLIDVLILLFCIFLLMPFVSGQPAVEPPPEAKDTPEKKLPEDVKTLQALLLEEKSRVERLEREKHSDYLKKHMTVCVLDIDPRNGALVYFDPDRQEIKSEADALRLISRQKALASKGGVVKDVYFLIRLPRKVGAFPSYGQLVHYEYWFKDVPYGFDKP